MVPQPCPRGETSVETPEVDRALPTKRRRAHCARGQGSLSLRRRCPTERASRVMGLSWISNAVEALFQFGSWKSQSESTAQDAWSYCTDEAAANTVPA